MTQQEALKLALEALELEDMACRYEKDSTPEHIAKAITAIKEALAQPPQRTWVGLTAQEAATIAESVYGLAHHDDITFFIEIQTKLKEKNT